MEKKSFLPEPGPEKTPPEGGLLGKSLEKGGESHIEDIISGNGASLEDPKPAFPSYDEGQSSEADPAEKYWRGPDAPEGGFSSPKEELIWIGNWLAQSLGRWYFEEVDPFLLKELQGRQKELFKMLYGEDLDGDDKFEIISS